MDKHPSKMAIHFSSASSEWGTPQFLFDRLNAEHHFDLDVCASADNAKCAAYFAKEQDALKQEWHGSCFMNPPYGRQIGRWVGKALEEASERRAERVVCLLPARTDTQWFHAYCIWGEIIFLRGRLRFEGAPHAAPFPSMIVAFYRGLPERRRGKVQWGLSSFGR